MMNKYSVHNEKTVEQMINEYKNAGWERLFPENPELEEIFMN
jgi:hypothetical protein